LARDKALREAVAERTGGAGQPAAAPDPGASNPPADAAVEVEPPEGAAVEVEPPEGAAVEVEPPEGAEAPPAGEPDAD
jgi:hypothetical protein